ncbi:hypothetical protein [Nocardioides sp. zg-DK7169]|uniref:hypothetical protein n=1 Tax=Nocardioides sp. zg-DK7169 TaxID=2736600 RepID=UPI0015562E8A|nr:hypothetical protein [Nocardioides sp. zg-DK7169]NPC98404.1 hypothetical protein [Nocardioides sp. zg-DK7169]
MTDQTLADLLRHAPDDLDPTTADRILGAAMTSGTRRRRGRHLAIAGAALSSAAVLALAVSASGVVGGSDPRSPAVAGAPDPSPAVTSEPAAAPDPGDADTRGPVIATDRAIADDAALRAGLTDLLAGAGELSGLSVAAHETSDPSTIGAPPEGRRVGFLLDGGAASVVVQRWDGIAAVGSTLALGDPSGERRDRIAAAGRTPAQGDTSIAPGEMVATTAAEACAGAYQTYPAIECREAPAGWYSVARPSQGDAMPDSYRELLVSLYTPDGYVVRVDSFNTPGEKVGPVVAEQPVLTEAESLALASSDLWFVTR